MDSVNEYRAVYFDCDSTLVTIEGIDELACMRDQETRDRLIALTNEAMQGTLPLKDVYCTRLDIIKPTRDEVQAIGQMYIDHLVTDAQAVVSALQSLGKHVGIVSGGLLPPVRHLADHLGIDDVHAVGVSFDKSGVYTSFDRRSPLCTCHGKSAVLERIPDAHRPACLIGDGVTDMEASRVIDLFVGFGGVVVRDAVKRGARHFIEGNSLAPLLPLVLDSHELERLRADDSFRVLVK